MLTISEQILQLDNNKKKKKWYTDMRPITNDHYQNTLKILKMYGVHSK